MLSESEYLIITIKNKLERILYLHRNEGEQSKIYNSIVAAHNALDEIGKNLK